jgi:hypothetical protein
MWHKMTSAVLAIGLALPVIAQEWQDRAGDQLFDPADLSERLIGKTLEFYDGGQSHYREDGTYMWSYAGGGDWHGKWRVTAGSVVCVDFITEVTRCDRVVENGGRLVVLTAEGQRFPVRD